MLQTLHGYVFRELFKTFALTVLALTGLFTLGGGLYNAMRYESVTASDLFHVLPMLLPIAVTITMPISALFAATMLYGRLSADNELMACRAAGINVHQMLMPAMLLAVGVTLFSLFSTNLVIPRFMKAIEYYARRNLRDLAFHKLRQSGVVEYRRKGGGDRYFLTAQSVRNVTDGALIKAGFEPQSMYVKYFWVDKPVFLWVDSDERLKRYAVAEGGLCMFDTRGDQVKLSLYVRNARDYEAGKPTAIVENQKIGPIPAPIPFPVRPSMVGLSTLRAWRAAPWLYPDLAKQVNAFIEQLHVYNIYQRLAARLASGASLDLRDPDRRVYSLACERVAKGDHAVDMIRPEIRRQSGIDGRTIRAIAPLGRLRISRNTAGNLIVSVRLEREGQAAVLEYNLRVSDDRPVRKDTWQSPELRLPATLLADLPEYAPRVVLDESAEISIDTSMAPALKKLRDKSRRLKRKITALIHSRLSFAASALVTVIMGAVLGVMFRGSRALAAFGLACIPFGAAALFILVGRQQIDSNAANMVGQTIIWGGLGLVAVADLLLLRFGVPR